MPMILLLRTHVVSCNALLTLAPIFIIHVCIIVITNDTIHVHTLFLHFMKEKQPSFVCTNTEHQYLSKCTPFLNEDKETHAIAAVN